MRTVVLKLEQATTKRTVKTLIAGPAPQSFDSVALNQGLRICISNKLLGDVMLLFWKPHSENH